MTHINCCVVRLDHASHVGLEYSRGEKWSEYLAFEPEGPKKFKELTQKYEERFYRPSSITPEGAALSFLRAAQGAYLPGDGVNEIILEIYIMAKTNGTGNLKDLEAKELLALYNELATSLKRTALKTFKEGKPKLIAKIKALQADASKLTKPQADAKARASEAAAKRFASIPKKEKAERMPRAAAPTTKLRGAKQAKQKKAGAAPKRGIGAFCVGLIEKGKSNEEILAAVKKEFPDAATSAASVAWYRNKVNSEGKA